MKKLKIVFDCDGVMGDFIETLLVKYNMKYGVNLTYRDIRTGNLAKASLPGTDMLSFLNDIDIYRSMKPYCEAQVLIEKLINDGHEVFVCTAVAPEFIKARAEWLKKFFPLIRQDNYIFAQNKTLVGGDIFIDDAIHNLVACSARFKILLTRPWNESVSNKYVGYINEVNRVSEKNAYDEIYEKVNTLSGVMKAS